MADTPPKILTAEQYRALSLEERMAYLQGLMNEISQKLEETRAQAEKTKRLTEGYGSG
jgi:TolA-binding protein